MYRDLVYRPGEDSYDTRDLVFRPGVDTNAYQTVLREPVGRQVSFAEITPYPAKKTPGIVEEKPRDPGIDERPRSDYEPAFGQDFINKIEQAGRTAKAFLDMYLLSGGALGPAVAGYVPFVPVAPGDIDPGGSEPGPEAAMADYVRRHRERGVFDKARQRLMDKGFPLGGV